MEGCPVPRSEKAKAQFSIRHIRARVWWPNRTLGNPELGRYKKYLSGLLPEENEVLVVGGDAGEATAWGRRGIDVLLVPSELIFQCQSRTRAEDALTILLDCLRQLPVTKRPGIRMDLHLGGELSLPGVTDAASLINPASLGLAFAAVNRLEGQVARCGVSLYMCQHPVHTTISLAPGLAGKDTIWVYLARQGFSFVQTAKVDRFLSGTVRMAREDIAALVRNSWVTEEGQ